MPNLIIEIGNTALKAAWAEGLTLGKTYRYQGEKVIEFILSLTQKEKPLSMVIASVYDISEANKTLLKKECSSLILLDNAHSEILSQYGLPESLTYDRASSIIAARYLFKGKGCTIFDFGTTLTVDFTDEKGEYCGGNISLGCRTSFKAINRYSKALPLINTPEETSIIGNTITSSIESGIISGIMFELNGYYAIYPDNIVVFTGGDANYFAKKMKKAIFVICNLVLIGLAIIADEYVKKNSL